MYDPTFYTDTDYIDDDLTTAEFVDGAYPTYTYNQTKEFFNYSNETTDLTDGVSTSDICVCVVGGDSFRCGETATVTYVAAAAPAPVEGVVGFFVGDLLWVDWMDGQIAAQEASTPLICETNQYRVTLILPDDTEIVDDTYCLGDIAIANHLCALPVDRLTDEHGFAECD